jgi:hypothetical protein
MSGDATGDEARGRWLRALLDEGPRPRRRRSGPGKPAADGTPGASGTAAAVLGLARDRPAVHEGMAVIGADGQRMGHVKEVRDADFRADRTLLQLLQGDVYVPFDAIHAVTDEGIVLTIPAAQVQTMGWPSPSLFG